MSEIKEVKIQVPEGYEVDRDKSTFETIVFKPIIEREFGGYYITEISDIRYLPGCNIRREENYNVFATEEGCKCSLALSRLSQIVEEINSKYEDEEHKYGIIIEVNYYFSTVFPNLIRFNCKAGAVMFLKNKEYISLLSIAYKYLCGLDCKTENLSIKRL